MDKRCDELFLCLLETIDLTMEQIETLCPGTSDALPGKRLRRT